MPKSNLIFASRRGSDTSFSLPLVLVVGFCSFFLFFFHAELCQTASPRLRWNGVGSLSAHSSMNAKTCPAFSWSFPSRRWELFSVISAVCMVLVIFLLHRIIVVVWIVCLLPRLRVPVYSTQSVTHCIIGSAEALPILCVRYFWWEREREIQRKRDRRKWRHHCRAKSGDEFTLSLAKKSHNWRWAYTFPCHKKTHFSILPSHFPSLPSRRGHHGGAEIRNEFTLKLSIAKIGKIFFALRLCSPSFKWHEPRDEWSKTQGKSCPVLFCSSHRKTESN